MNALSCWKYALHLTQGRNHGIDIGGVQMWAPSPDIFFFSSVADQIVKTNRPGHQRMNRGLSMEWEVRELLGLWLQQFIIHYLLFRCLLAYHLKKRRMSACSSCFFLLDPTFISFKDQWQSDWAVFSNDAASRRLRAQPSVQSRGGGHTVLFPLFFLNWK